jgi:hypothetical protein
MIFLSLGHQDRQLCHVDDFGKPNLQQVATKAIF